MIGHSLVLLKPGAVRRGVVGEILHRFERAGLKIVGAKFMQADETLGSKHYDHDDEWKLKVGQRGIEDCEKYHVDVLDAFGTKNPKELFSYKRVHEDLYLY